MATETTQKQESNAVSGNSPAKTVTENPVTNPAKPVTENGTKPVKAQPPKRSKVKASSRKVPAQTKRALARMTSQGVKKASEKLENLTDLERAAVEGINKARAIVGTKLAAEGKLSQLGHMTSRQNGKLDVAIISMEGVDFPAWAKAVANGEQIGRKTDLTDNAGMLRRMRDHFNYLGGKRADSREFKKRLAKVGKADKYNELMEALKPAADLFEQYVANTI